MFYPAGGQQYTLGSSISSTQTTILLSSFTEPVTGTPYTMALLNTDIAYGTIAPKTSQSEFISFTGITQNANGTATLTGVTRGLAKKYPFTASASYRLPHSGGSIFILSDVPQLFEKYISIENDVTITGVKTFTNPDYPRMDTATPAPTDDEQLVPKKYVDDAVISGGVPATTSVLGIVKISVAAADPANPIAVGDNDPRVANTVSSGHTGLTSGTSGGILGFTGSTTIASSVALTQHALVLGGGAGATPTPLGSLGTTTTVLHGNASGAPSFGAVVLTTDVSGILPAANGGSGSALGIGLTANADPASMAYDTTIVDLPYSASGGTQLFGWTSSNVAIVATTGTDFRYIGFNSGNMEKILATLTTVAGFQDFKFDSGKDIYIQNKISVDPATTGTNSNAIAYGLGNSTSANFYDETSTTEAIKFVWKNVSGTYTLYCVTANGTNVESTSTTAFTFTNSNEYSIAWVGSTVTYKVNGTTVATHSTYVPSSTNTVYMRIQNNSTTAAITMTKPKVGIEI